MTFWDWVVFVFLVAVQTALVISTRVSVRRAELAALRSRRVLIKAISELREELYQQKLESSQERRQKLRDSQTTRLLPVVTTRNGGRHRSPEEIQEAVTELLPRVEE